MSASAFLGFLCQRCGAREEDVPSGTTCPTCLTDGVLASWYAQYDLAAAEEAWQRRSGRGLWRYAGLLPVRQESSRVSLGEGGTPLLRYADALGDGVRVWLKNETANPTFSYKDRLAAVGVSAAVESGAQVVAASSSGNHGASTAAFAAAAGLRSVVFTRDDVGDPTLAMLQVYGAKVVTTTARGRWELLSHGMRTRGWYPLSTFSPDAIGSPYGVEGYATIAYEVVEELGHAPAAVIVPTCYGEGLAGTWSGFEQLRRLGIIDATPRMVAVEPSGGGPLTRTLASGADAVERVAAYSTVAVSISATIASERSLRALRSSDGTAVTVTDEEIMAAQGSLGAAGVFAEPAGSAGVASLTTHRELLRSAVDSGQDVVVLITGGGVRTAAETRKVLKDPISCEAAAASFEKVLAEWDMRDGLL